MSSIWNIVSNHIIIVILQSDSISKKNTCCSNSCNKRRSNTDGSFCLDRIKSHRRNAKCSKCFIGTTRGRNGNRGCRSWCITKSTISNTNGRNCSCDRNSWCCCCGYWTWGTKCNCWSDSVSKIRLLLLYQLPMNQIHQRIPQ